MLDALGTAKTIIGDELESKKAELAARLGEGKQVRILSYAGGAGQGKLTKSNDRELFHWSGVTVEDGGEKREYLIDLFYNEVDPRSHNFHTQTGHFQFAALLPGTNSPHEKGPNGSYRFHEERLGDSKRSHSTTKSIKSSTSFSGTNGFSSVGASP